VRVPPTKAWDVGALHRKSKRVKINAECTLTSPLLRGDALFAADFDHSEWEIMYPHFVEEGLVDPSDRVNKRNV
jgi:hypothetical protein